MVQHERQRGLLTQIKRERTDERLERRIWRNVHGHPTQRNIGGGERTGTTPSDLMSDLVGNKDRRKVVQEGQAIKLV